MQKIAIFGSPGSGKSTLAQQVSARLNIPIVHLDALLWYPNWENVPDNQWQAELGAVRRQPQWIIDGFHPDAIDFYLDLADGVIFLDLPPLLCLSQAIGRYLHYAKTSRPDLPGYEECLEWDILKGIWYSPQTTRPVILHKIQQHGKTEQFYRLRSKGAIANFLQLQLRARVGLEQRFALEDMDLVNHHTTAAQGQFR
jgi:adenylate kinase family enzyme